MPSTFKFNYENIERLKTFKENGSLDKKAVIEFRDRSWWKKNSLVELDKLKLSMCSVDAPQLPKKLLNLNNVVYLRLHGSKSWYNYLYSEKELLNIINKMQKMPGIKKAIYLNNDHGMLPNGKFLMDQISRS